MSQEKNWENNLRNGENTKTSYKFLRNKNASRSPQKNTESQDYNHWDFYRKINQVENQSYIIADPFKPTMNIWIKKEKKEKEKDNYKPT
jgi:hypothetical protein